MATITFPGLASGLDTQALIDAASQATRQTRVKPSQDRVAQLEETNTALEDLQKKLETLRSNLREFTTLAGGGISKTGTSSKESVVSATATNGASNGSYSITVNALASNHTYSFDTTYASTITALQSTLTGGESAADRTVTFTVGTGAEQETVSVEVTDGSYSISDFVTAFNNSSTKARASLVNIGTSATPAYKLVISSLYEGTEKGLVARTALGASLTNLTAYSESAASDSSVDITGLGTITRSTNSISDVIPGVTLNVASQGNATVRIGEDVSSTTTKIQDLVDSYNEIVTFLGENNQVTRDESQKEVKNKFGALASTRIDDNLLSSLRSAIAEASATGGSAVKVFADIGITSQRDGTLTFDSKKFQEAMSSESTSVGSILSDFADNAALTGGIIDQYIRYQGLFDTTLESNKTSITDLNRRIADTEKQIARNEEMLKQRYARLESLMGKLQNQQSSLTSALAGLK